ncbi:MAG: transglutaminase-like domain-containing protein, partial [Planctomycetota bacterium]|nr:transglutaminase-like domain-containing protein [Planctomycetota bacterium]
LHFTALANEKGEVPFEITYHLSRQETLRNEGEDLSNEDAKLYKQGTSFVPTNKDLSATVLGGTSLKESPLVAGRQIYNAVNEYMEYDKPEGKGWGRGDSVWACGNGFGNCTDFHSLFISVCREQDIPARFEIGFSIPSERGAGTIGGYHCWAKFAADNQWIPVDISEADKEPSLTDYYYGNLTANRITFSTGRDLTLTPAQQAGPVNFLIYPYAEVAGKVHSVFRKSFLYEDIQ